MPSSLVILYIRLFTVVGIAVMSVRLYRFGLHRKYRVFFAYLIFWTLRSSVLLIVDVKSGLYAQIWILTEPILWLFYILTVLELYSLVLENHKGLYTLGRWALYGALAVSLLISVMSLFTPGSGPARQTQLLYDYYLIGRGIIFSLAIFLFLILVFLTRYPVPLSRNVIVHSIVYSVYFLTHTLGLLFRSVLGYEVTRSVSMFLMAGSLACVVVWLIFLDPKGEAQTVTLKHSWQPEQEERLIDQLTAINTTLLRAARK